VNKIFCSTTVVGNCWLEIGSLNKRELFLLSGFYMKIVFIDKKVENFIWTLEKTTIAKVLRTIDLLEIFGNRLSMPHSRYVFENLFELRIRGTQEIRLFYTFYNAQAIILHGFIKKSFKLPNKEINKAKEKMKRLAPL
jgi:hypothetical protein